LDVKRLKERLQVCLQVVEQLLNVGLELVRVGLGEAADDGFDVGDSLLDLSGDLVISGQCLYVEANGQLFIEWSKHR